MAARMPSKPATTALQTRVARVSLTRSVISRFADPVSTIDRVNAL
jgi:hypothetical protein